MSMEPLRYNTPVVNAAGNPTPFFLRLWENLFRRPIFALASAQNPGRDGDMVIEATSNTTLTIKYRGQDGVVRSATLTLT